MSDPLLDREIRTDLSMQVVARDGQIHLLFSEEDKQTKETVKTYTSNFLLSASDALTFSSLLADLAYEIETGLKIPNAQKEELIQRHRKTLMDRIAVILNSQREKKTINNRSLARSLVDVMSKEVFS